MTDFTAFQIIQYDFIVAPAIHYIKFELYINVLCCRHLQVAKPSKNAHDDLKHIVCFVLQIHISAILRGERLQATNSIVHIRKYNGECIFLYMYFYYRIKYCLNQIQRRIHPRKPRGPAALTSPLEPHPVNCVLHNTVALRNYQHFFTI